MTFFLDILFSFPCISCSGRKNVVNSPLGMLTWRGIKTSATNHVSELRVDPLVPNKSSKIAMLANSLTAILLEPDLFSYIYPSQIFGLQI